MAHGVWIFRDDRVQVPGDRDYDHDFAVAPGQLAVKVGSNVFFHNAAAVDAMIRFVDSDRNPFGADFSVPAGDEPTRKTLSQNAAPGVYRYDVYCGNDPKDLKRAHATRPIIIVYP